MSLLIRNVEVAGRPDLDVRIEAGRIVEIGPGLRGGDGAIDGEGGALIPGLIDHHIHLMALAAQAQSIRLDAARSASDVARRIASAAAAIPAGEWLRAIGYHEGAAGLLGAAELDALAPRHPLRVQHRTGQLWILNSHALRLALGEDPPPACVELDAAGRPTGRVWGGDAWLSERIGRTPPRLAPVGQRLAAMGVTGLTDASVTTDQVAAQALAVGDLPQRLMLMSGGPLTPLPGAAVGPVKVLLNEAELPDLDGLIERIGEARRWRRAVAVHCATAIELAFTLAAFEAAGARPGDRIEHGSVIPQSALPTLAALRLTVVTQPAFVAERGDRYLDEVASDDQGDLYRLASLRRAGVALAASSDAPYGEPDPWAAIRAAARRRTRRGQAIGLAEQVTARTALAMWLGGFARPGRPRRVRVGAAADLCLLAAPLAEALRAPAAEMVAATLVGGRVVFDRRRSAARAA